MVLSSHQFDSIHQQNLGVKGPEVGGHPWHSMNSGSLLPAGLPPQKVWHLKESNCLIKI